MSTDERIMKEAVAEANAWRTRAEQAEALVGRLRATLQEVINCVRQDGPQGDREHCNYFVSSGCGPRFTQAIISTLSVLADPLATRLAEEQRALDGLLQAAKTTIRLGSSGVFHELESAVAAVERARGTDGHV